MPDHVGLHQDQLPTGHRCSLCRCTTGPFPGSTTAPLSSLATNIHPHLEGHASGWGMRKSKDYSLLKVKHSKDRA